MNLQFTFDDQEADDLLYFLIECKEHFNFEDAYSETGYKMLSQIENWIKDLKEGLSK